MFGKLSRTLRGKFNARAVWRANLISVIYDDFSIIVSYKMQILSKLTSSNFAICSQFIFHKNIPQILMYAEKKRLMRKHFFVTCLIRLELTELISFQPSIKPHLIQQLQRKQQWIYPLLFCSYRCCYYCCNCSFCYSCYSS